MNLSEDVFAGYKTVLRGGRVVFREYHHVGKGRMTNLGEISAFFAKLSQGAACQVMSRDLYRLVKALPLDRQVRLLQAGPARRQPSKASLSVTTAPLQLSLVSGGFSFYVVTWLTMAIVFATAFLLVLLNLGL